ncbi:MAG: PEGA domain-containing protein [Oceanidesulfovibrio sp.]
MRMLFHGLLPFVCFLLFAVSAAAQQNGTIVLETTPADALVRIMNIAPPYEEGMSLEPGVYDVEVSKKGYVTERKDVTVQGGKANRFTFALKEAPPEGTMVVYTEPADALVRIMNIAPPYEEGMSLKQDEYTLEISKPGYETRTDTVNLKAGQENRYSYTLKSAAPEPVTEPPAAAPGAEEQTITQAQENTPDETAATGAEQPEQTATEMPQASAEAEQAPGANATTGTLTVVAEPRNATVRIMDIKPPYEDGIALEPGLYALEISHPGYATQSLDYMVEAGTENTVTVTLAPEDSTGTAFPSPAAPAQDSPAMRAELVEDFDNNDRDWYETTSPQVEIAVQSGHYHIAHKDDAQGWIAWNKAPFDPEIDFAVEATFKKVDGVLDYGYGLIWGVTSKGESYHSFRISGNGLYSYRQEKAGQLSTIIDWTPSPAIVPGLGATNTIQIRRQGDTLDFYINGELVDSTPYIPADGTMVGFKVDNRQIVNVESLKVGLAQ